MTTWRRTVCGLRTWARGGYAAEAAVELLVRAMDGRSASPDWPWVRANPISGWYWIDPDAIIAGSGRLSGGERRLLAVVAALVGGPPLSDLADVLAGLDRSNLALVLAAFAHAGGSHEHTLLQFTDAGPEFDRPGALVDWPSTDQRGGDVRDSDCGTGVAG